jgi:hypothetical protein
MYVITPMVILVHHAAGESTFLSEPVTDAATLLKLQAASGMGAEDAQMVVEAMAQSGVEPTFCMGDDIPLPVLSDKPHPLYNYFKQRFAQVRYWAVGYYHMLEHVLQHKGCRV